MSEFFNYAIGGVCAGVSIFALSLFAVVVISAWENHKERAKVVDELVRKRREKKK